ncbi:MAG: hypothetical protein IJP03_03420 [Christensenellaceae bacterium]|nr:hypothetical protein [Christensenellaceae bacterium]
MARRSEILASALKKMPFEEKLRYLTAFQRQYLHGYIDRALFESGYPAQNQTFTQSPKKNSKMNNGKLQHF